MLGLLAPGSNSAFLVMDFLEHDLKTLLDDMREPFLPSEIKTLLLQVISGLDFLHSHWIMHRDLKTSNLLMNNRGEVKIADFGMARYYGDPPPKLTQLVVTLWYRSPELLLGAEKYGMEIDMWSIGCIFGELLTKEPLLQGKNEVDQVSKVCLLYLFRLSNPIQSTHSILTSTPDLRVNRPSNSPNLARVPCPPQRQIATHPIISNLNSPTRESAFTPADEVPVPHKRGPAPSLISSRIEPQFTTVNRAMSLASVFPGRPAAEIQGDVPYVPVQGRNGEAEKAADA